MSDAGDPVELLRRADVLEVLEHRFPRKQLGQNFVVDPGTIRRIVRSAGVQPGDAVVEIGPGVGSLTLGLLEAGAEVTCVEKDADLVPVLADTVARFAPGRSIDLRCDDALDTDFTTLTAGERPWLLVANLPYNVSAPLIIKVLETAPQIERILVMVQREVAERFAAGPGSKAYGIPSVLVALDATARMVGTIGPEVFYPRPRITSALIEFRRLPPADRVTEHRELIRRLVKTAFGQRRKTVRRTLGLSEDVFAAAEIDPSARPEQLGVDVWRRLAAAVADDPAHAAQWGASTAGATVGAQPDETDDEPDDEPDDGGQT